MTEVEGMEVEIEIEADVDPSTSTPPAPEPEQDYASLLRKLPDYLNEEDYVHHETRKPEKTKCETDEGLVIAQNRRFHYRGRAVQSFRPRERINPVHGLIRMLNGSLRRPPGVNEIVRMNPKYDIILEEKPSQKSSQCSARRNGDVDVTTEGTDDPHNHYVVREIVGEAKKTERCSLLWQDPCNTSVYPLRFSTLQSSIAENILTKWPDDTIVPVGDARNHAIKYFDFQAWSSGDIETSHYLMDQDCKVIVLVGVLISLTSVSDKFIEETCRRHRLLYLPSVRRPVTGVWKSGQFSDGEGKTGVRLFAKSSSGLNLDDIVSGIPCAVRGFGVPGNGFVVADIAWATPKPTVWPKLSGDTRTDLVFISGLNFGSRPFDSIGIDLLKDYLLGLSGSPNEQKYEIMPKTRVVFVGNSFGIPSKDGLSPVQNKDLTVVAEKLDTFFSALAETMELFLIPGETDVSEKLLPQKPLQPILFPHLSSTGLSHSFHNPCRLKMILDLEDPSQFLDVILSSGSNISEVRKYVGDESSLFIAENMLKWGHINPAAPDFFPVENVPKSDVFAIVDNLPHLYIIGNQEQFGVREFNKTKIVSLPAFSKSRQIVTLQLTKDSHKIVPMEFKILDF